MKLFNLNCRIDVPEDGEYQFIHRKNSILELIQSQKPSVLTFQEVYPRMQHALAEGLPDHYVWLGRSRSLDWTDEFPALVFDASQYYLRDVRQAWMSYTPEIPGSRFPEQSICPRMYVIALLEERKTHQLVVVGTTHLDHQSVQARFLGITQVMGELVKMIDQVSLPCLPVVLTGDFNAEPDEMTLEIATKMPLMVDGTDHLRELSSDIPYTFHHFGKMHRPIKIDYILGSDAVEHSTVKPYVKDEAGHFYSDHIAMVADLEFTECKAPC